MIKGMTELKSYDFCKQICEENNIEFNTKVIIGYEKDFPLRENGTRKISASYHSFIVDKEGNTHKYMLNHYQRNEEVLKSFDYIYINSFVSISELINDYGIEITSEKCKISEGNGWFSDGVRYIYKNIYCEP